MNVIPYDQRSLSFVRFRSTRPDSSSCKQRPVPEKSSFHSDDVMNDSMEDDVVFQAESVFLFSNPTSLIASELQSERKTSKRPRPHHPSSIHNEPSPSLPDIEPLLHKRRREHHHSDHNHLLDMSVSSIHRHDALSIDLVLSHIIGFLPWREQFSTCSLVSKEWNVAVQTAPMRWMLLPDNTTVNQTPLPRVLLPCQLDQLQNQIRVPSCCLWKDATAHCTFQKLSMRKLTRLEVYGDNLNDTIESVALIGRPLPQLEELQVRHTSMDVLHHMFEPPARPSTKNNTTETSTIPPDIMFPNLKRLIIEHVNWRRREQHVELSHKDDAETRNQSQDHVRNLLHQITYHAPNVTELQVHLPQVTIDHQSTLLQQGQPR